MKNKLFKKIALGFILGGGIGSGLASENKSVLPSELLVRRIPVDQIEEIQLERSPSLNGTIFPPYLSLYSPFLKMNLRDARKVTLCDNFANIVSTSSDFKDVISVPVFGAVTKENEEEKINISTLLMSHSDAASTSNSSLELSSTSDEGTDFLSMLNWGSTSSEEDLS